MQGRARKTSRAASRVALAFAYDGTAFDSFARQPARRTVEGELLRILIGAGAISSARAARYEVASRTDARVSAAWNVCAFDADLDARRLAHLRHDVDGLWLLSAAGVGASFSPRREASLKRYVYHVPEPGRFDWSRIAAAAPLFVGHHDFRNYCRPDRGVASRRTLSRLDVETGRLVFEAPNFLWEQVRRITHALLAVGSGEATDEDLRRRLGDARRVDPQPPAAGDGLVLERVDVPVAFPLVSKSKRKQLADARRSAFLRHRFYETLASAPTDRR